MISWSCGLELFWDQKHLLRRLFVALGVRGFLTWSKFPVNLMKLKEDKGKGG